MCDIINKLRGNLLMYKICYVTTISQSIDIFIKDSAQYLADTNEFDITFICNEDKEFAKRLPENMHYHPIDMKRGISLGGFKATYEMYKFFKKNHFDLVQYTSPNASCYASIAARLAKIPIRLYCQWGMVYVGASGIKRKILKLLEKITCENSTVIEPDSRGNLNFCVSEKLYPASKAMVVGPGSANGINLERFDIKRHEEYRKEIREKYHIPTDNYVYGFVGRLGKDKGIDELFLAYKEVENEKTNLLVVGPMDKQDTLNAELLRWAQENPSIIFTGQTNEAEKYYPAMDVFVFPSYREGFGTVVLEAQASGIPVIITNIPGPTEGMLEGKTGLIVEAKDVHGLKNAMQKIASFDVARSYRDACVEFVQKFECKKMFKLIYDNRKMLLESQKK